MERKIKAILIGAGLRGKAYTDVMAEAKDKFKLVAVAEPVENRRNYIKDSHQIPDEMCFDNWESLLELGKIADVALICTMDRQHFEPAMKSMLNYYR